MARGGAAGFFDAPVSAVSLADSADHQLGQLLAFFEAPGRGRPPNPEAANNLIVALNDVRLLLLSGRAVRRRYPATFRTMARDGEGWVRVHRYWFGYRRDGDRAEIFAVLDASSNMPDRR